MAEIAKPNMSVLWAESGARSSPTTSKMAIGWVAEIPSFQDENYVQYRQDQGIKYLFQHGIPEWSSSEEYFTNRSVVWYQGRMYVAKRNNVGQAPISSPDDWYDYANFVAGQVVIPSTTPAGIVSAYGGTTDPDGYLICNGRAVSRTTHAELFAVIGTIYGNGDGTTTFNIPDLRGEFIRGLDAGRLVDSGREIGSNQSDSFRSHSHSVNDPGHRHMQTKQDDHGAQGGESTNSPDYRTGNIDVGYTRSTTTGVSINSSGGSETRPRNVAMNYIIKY